MSKFASKFVENVRPYKGREKPEDKKTLRLDWNESTIPPSPKVIEKISDFLKHGQLNCYPEPDNLELMEKLSKYLKVSPDNILLFNGSDFALDCIAKTFVDVDDKIVYVFPSYDNFRFYLEIKGAKIFEFYFSNIFGPQHIEELIKVVQKVKPKITYLANPDNPTGTIFGASDIEKYLQNTHDTLLVLDEAYIEFNPEHSSLELIGHYGNLLITRTFSKVFCLASLRCGYAVSSPEIISDMKKVRNMMEVNQIAQIAACAALDDLEYMRKYVSEVKKSKILLASELKKMGIVYEMGYGNFFLMKFDQPIKIKEELKKRGIIVRDKSSSKGLEGFLRVTIGDFDTTKQFINILKELLK
jgi:histidinol-phosphate aminotransferase